ncbi:universal stress protein UspA, partial [Salmonella enterica subsp. enterica serovar Java]|nr:universal stress protein UspA [Salmonella enterica subsp. enterica serovar Java]
MYKNILIATDGSDLAGKGMDQGMALAKALGSKVTVVTVTEPYPFYVASSAGWSPSATEIDAYMQGQKEVAAHVLDGAAKLAASAGVDVAVRHVPDRWP